MSPRRIRTACSVVCVGLLVFFAAPSHAQVGSGFDSIHSASIESNARTGDFTIPFPFTASRRDVDISGDRAVGNASNKLVVIDGHVVVHIKHSVSLGGEASGSEKGPSTLRCDHLEIDEQNRQYHATGNVRYLQGERSVTADAADFDEASNQMRMDGHVSIAGAGTSGIAGGFDWLKTARITSNSSAGDFTIPGHFQAMRQGVEITGDRASGNTRSHNLSVIGNVVVKMKKRSGTLTCDRLNIDSAHRSYHAIGNVRYAEPARTLTADAADMSEATHILHMQGRVHVTDTNKEKT